jgi:hypothetical protein
MSTHVTAAAFWDGDKLQLADVVTYRAGLRRMKLGQGEEVVIRVERPEDAYTYGQLKHYYGHLVGPVVEYTGDTDWHRMLKAMFLHDGKTSLTQCDRDELDLYIKAVEQYLYERIPEAFEGRRERA